MCLTSVCPVLSTRFVHCPLSLLYPFLFLLAQGKRNLASQTSTSSARNSKGTDMKHIMANAIMGGGGTARERLRQRKGLAREQPQGLYRHVSESSQRVF